MLSADGRFVLVFNGEIYNHRDLRRELEQDGSAPAHLGTDHTELYVEPEQARAVIPDLPRLYDELFVDSSQIPTFLVSKLIRQYVTVALSVDGGDELFAAYTRYALGLNIRKQMERVPAPLRHPLRGRPRPAAHGPAATAARGPTAAAGRYPQGAAARAFVSRSDLALAPPARVGAQQPRTGHRAQ
jgi:asparagine synthase (glutamine-hydrolysing)